MLKGEGQVAWETDGTCCAHVLTVMSYTAGTRSQEHFTRKPLLKAKQHSPQESSAGDACTSPGDQAELGLNPHWESTR